MSTKTKTKLDEGELIVAPTDPLTVPANYIIPKSQIKEGEKAVYISDCQGKFVDTKLMKAIDKYIEKAKPDRIFYVGDIMEFWAYSDFEKDPRVDMSVDSEIDWCNDLLDTHKKLSPKSKQYFIEGNHEDRCRREMWNRGKPVSQRLTISLPEALKTKERDMVYVKYRYHVDYAGFIITHGEATTENDAKKNLLDYLSSGCSGHTNRPKEWMAMGMKDQEPHTWYVLGMTCRKDIGSFIPAWRKQKCWMQGFGLSEIHNGKIFFQLVRVHDGGFFAAGDFYKV